MTTTYVILLTGDESAWDQLTPDQQAEVFARHEEFATLLEARGHQLIGGQELTPSSTTRTITKAAGGDAIVSEGPYAETVEQLGAFYTVTSNNLDDLLDICTVLADTGGAVEVRAAVDHGDNGG